MCLRANQPTSHITSAQRPHSAVSLNCVLWSSAWLKRFLPFTVLKANTLSKAKLSRPIWTEPYKHYNHQNKGNRFNVNYFISCVKVLSDAGGTEWKGNVFKHNSDKLSAENGIDAVSYSTCSPQEKPLSIAPRSSTGGSSLSGGVSERQNVAGGWWVDPDRGRQT